MDSQKVVEYFWNTNFGCSLKAEYCRNTVKIPPYRRRRIVQMKTTVCLIASAFMLSAVSMAQTPAAPVAATPAPAAQTAMKKEGKAIPAEVKAECKECKNKEMGKECKCPSKKKHAKKAEVKAEAKAEAVAPAAKVATPAKAAIPATPATPAATQTK
ncbi:MAG: hypothetical protein WCS77_07190 [Elusimicrobiaceae bacterium]|jgi:hypothetical protein